MALFDELLVKVAQGEKLSPGELESLRQAAQAVEETKNAVKTWMQPGTLNANFRLLRAHQASFDIPVTRGITYSFITNGTGLADGTWRDLAFSGSRGYIQPSDGCVYQRDGTTDKFVRNPAVKSDRSFMMIAEVTFPVADVTVGGFEVALDYYVNDVYDSSYVAYQNYHPDFVDNTTVVCVAHESIQDNEHIRLSVLQWNTGVSLDLISANLTFLMV